MKRDKVPSFRSPQQETTTRNEGSNILWLGIINVLYLLYSNKSWSPWSTFLEIVWDVYSTLVFVTCDANRHLHVWVNQANGMLPFGASPTSTIPIRVIYHRNNCNVLEIGTPWLFAHVNDGNNWVLLCAVITFSTTI